MMGKGKETLKIAGIALGSLLGVVLLAAGLACWIIFTPGRLTKVAQKAIDRYVPCRTEMDRIDLTLVDTYPFLAFRLNGLKVYDDMEDSPYEILTSVGELAVTVDFKTLWKERRIIVTNLFVDGVQANMFTAADGRTNIDVFLGEESDDTDTETQDFNLYLDLQKVAINNVGASYDDRSSGTAACLKDLDITLKGLLKPDSLQAGVSMNIAEISAGIKNDTTDISASTGGIEFKGNAAKYHDRVSGNAGITLGVTNCSMDGMTAGIGSLELDVPVFSCCVGQDGISDIRASIGRLDSRSVDFSLDGMKAAIESLVFNASQATYENGYAQVKELDADIADIEFSMSDSTGEDPMTAYIGKLSLLSDADLDIETLNTASDNSFVLEDVSFSTGGDTAFIVKSPDVSLHVTADIQGDRMNAFPILESTSFSLNLGDDVYIDALPVCFAVNASTNKDMSWFDISEGSRVDLDGQKVSFTANGSIKDSELAGTATVNAPDLNLDHLISLVPDCFKDLLDGIDIHGKFGINGRFKGAVREDGNELELAVADISFRDLDAHLYDTLEAKTQKFQAHVNYPSTQTDVRDSETADVSVLAQDIFFSMDGMTKLAASLTEVDLNASAAGITDTITEMSGVADIRFSKLDATMDTISLKMDNSSVSATLAPADGRPAFMANVTFDDLTAAMGQAMAASLGRTEMLAMACYDDTRDDLLLKWNPRLKLTLEDGQLDMLEAPVEIPTLDMDFSLGTFNINDSRFVMGNSDIVLWGDVYNIGAFLEDTGLLTGELFLESDYADVTQLMGWFSDDSGEAEETAEEMAQELEAGKDTVTSGPFMVPKGIDLTMYTNLSQINFNDHIFNDVGGDVTIKDGTAVLQELGFSSDAAEMQLTAIYKTQSIDDIFTQLDFHLLDIEIDQLIDLIPAVDSIVPMLKSFSGQANFHLTAETFMEPGYMPIMESLIGAAAIDGKNLTVLDSELFDGIKGKLLMSKDARNVIDSLDVEMQVLRNKVDVYPFVIHMDRYTVALGGRHNINSALDCQYHISVIDTPLPIRLGVDIEGALEDIAEHPLKHIKLVRPKYDKMFTPEKQGVADGKVLDMKKAIQETLRSNVR
ncbi:MAG: hypothetical protein MJY66_06715 [Bacteroidaceae bacterium]|nr:hypothetical protein [Bacteroidaceae bacterium]